MNFSSTDNENLASGMSARVAFGSDRHMRLLYVEDSPSDARLLIESIRGSGFGAYLNITHVGTLSLACKAVADEVFDCVLLDLGLPDGEGVGNVTRLLEIKPGITIVVMTGDDSDEVGLKAIHNGAQEYLVKGQIEFEALTRILRHAVQRNELLQELKALREREYFFATHDALTGLPNRQLFEDRARQMLVRAERNQEQLAICYLDLDGFKPVNDSFGHATGDILLQAVANCLGEVVRDSDTVARVGGDEFVLVLYPLEGQQEAQRIASRIIERVHAIKQAGEFNISVSCSIGISLYPAHGETLQELMHHADIAMYSSKSHGRGGFEYFNVEMLGRTHDRRQMIGEIDEGLRLKRFSADYQPWIDIENGQIKGVEALLRWRSIGGEIRHPNLFLHVAEASGQILKIARKVNEKSVKDWTGWRGEQLNPGELALNISARELRDTHYLRELTVLFENMSVPRNETQLHIDAVSATRVDATALHARFEYLRSQQYRLVLDNVTDQNISRDLLETLVYDELRLDASMLNGHTAQAGGRNGDDGSAFISDLLGLVSKRNAKVVAVGVETQAQADFLKGLGCTLMQGFLFGPPVSAEQVPAMLRRA